MPVQRVFVESFLYSFPVLHNTINMTLRQQNGIVRLKYTLHVYMHKLCASEIRVTTIHHSTHMRIYLTHIFVRVWHANQTHLKRYTLYLTGTIYTCACTCTMWNCFLITDIMIIIILCFLLSIYLWLQCEFRALVIRIYMYIVYTCMYLHCYLHAQCTSFVHVPHNVYCVS